MWSPLKNYPRDDRGRIINAVSMRTGARGNFRERMAVLIGDKTSLTPRLQVGFGRPHSTITKWFHDVSVPDDVWDIIDLLEHLQRRNWPKKWRLLLDHRQMKIMREPVENKTFRGNRLPRGSDPKYDEAVRPLIETAITMAESGLPTREIAKRLCVGENAVSNWRRDGKLPPSPVAIQRITLMPLAREMLSGGGPVAVVAENLGVTTATLRHWLEQRFLISGEPLDDYIDRIKSRYSDSQLKKWWPS